MEIARIKESFTVASLVTLLLFSPLITAIVFFVSCRWTWPFALIYAGWMFLDRQTDVRGGRWSDRVRRWSLWSLVARYFPMELVKTVDLDPKRSYIFGYHPHGRLTLGAVGHFATEATGFSRLFPGLRSHLMLIRLQFLFPFSRDLFLHLGACRVSRESCEYLLRGQGQALVIILGGVKEMKLAKENTMILYLRERKGFVRLALQHGASLVPVISFGENELYRRSSFSYLPRRQRLVAVVGAPLAVQATPDPSSETIDGVHQQYLRSVEQLFETHKETYGFGHVQLQLI